MFLIQRVVGAWNPLPGMMVEADMKVAFNGGIWIRSRRRRFDIMLSMDIVGHVDRSCAALSYAYNSENHSFLHTAKEKFSDTAFICSLYDRARLQDILYTTRDRQDKWRLLPASSKTTLH